MPTPRMSKNSTRAEADECANEVAHLRPLRDGLEMRAPVEAEDDVAWRVPDHLVRDVRVPAADVLRGC